MDTGVEEEDAAEGELGWSEGFSTVAVSSERMWGGYYGRGIISCTS